MAIDLVLLGHSFIRRLRDYMNNNHVNHNLRLHPARFMILCRAQGGLTIERLIHGRSDLFCFCIPHPKLFICKSVVMTYRPH